MPFIERIRGFVRGRRLRDAPTWSALGRLGQSRLMMLTSLVPFLGALILFNDQLVALFRLSATALGLDEAAATRATTSQLRYLYLGLLFLGLASILYRTACPAEVKEHATLQAWIEAQKTQVSPAWTKATFRQVISNYLWIVPKGTTNRNYPSAVANRLALMVDSIVRDAAWPEKEERLEALRVDGTITRRSIMDALMGREPQWQDFRRTVDVSLLQGYELDLLTLQYQAADHSDAAHRRAVSVVYGVGFFVLAIPAAKNVAAVFSLILSGR